MCKESWCVGLGQAVAVRVEGTVSNTLKGGGAEKRGGETNILKRGGKLGQRVGALKGGELKAPYEL